jgi:hypothetical protein
MKEYMRAVKTCRTTTCENCGQDRALHAVKGGISKFAFSGDDNDSKPVTMKTSMVEADFHGKGLGISGTIMVGAFLPKCT